MLNDILGEGNVLFCDGEMLMELPVSEKIIRILESDGIIFILTEFCVFSLNVGKLERIKFSGRDRPLAIIKEDDIILLITARGYLHQINDKSSRQYKLQSPSALFYSADLIINGNGIKVAFGTIFSGVLMATFDGAEFKESQTLSGHKGTVFDVKFLNSSTLFSCSDDRTVKKWNLNDGSCAATFIGHEARIWQISVTPGVVASVSEDNTCRVWHHDGQVESIIECNPFAKNTLSVCASGDLVLVGSSDNSRYLYNRQKRALTVHEAFKPQDQEIKNFILSPYDCVFSISKTGCIFKNAQEICRIEALSRYAVPCLTSEYLIIGDVSGRVHFSGLDDFKFAELKLSDGKISRLLALSAVEILIEVNEQKCFVLDLNSRNTIELQVPKGTKCTSAAKTDGFYYIGSRQGHLLSFSPDGSLMNSNLICPDESLKALSIKNGEIFIGSHSGILSVLNGSSKSLCKGEIVAFLKNSKFAAAFIQNSLHIIELSSGLTVERIDCKGSHRLWALVEADDSIYFGFLSEGALTVKRAFLDRLTIHGEPSHGEEIRCAHNYNDLVVSGSEDGLLCLSKNGSVQASTRVPKSNSIKCMTSCNSFVISAGGNESIDFWTADLKLVCSAPKQASLIESRVMAIDCIQRDDVSLIIAGYSNSSIVAWSFDGTKLALKWIHEEAHKGRCLQQLRVIAKDAIISAGTDGLLKLWRISDVSITILHSVCAHASGINALDCQADTIATGGDDGYICVFRLENDRLLLQTRRQSHHSTCTGVKFLNFKFLISTSIDQRLVLRNCQTLEPVASVMSAVSDIAALSVEQKDLVTVFGLGQESFLLNLE